MQGIQLTYDQDGMFTPVIEHGTLAIGTAEEQTVALLLNTAKGEWKENPALGADAIKQLGGTPDPFWRLDTEKMIRACGVEVNSITITEDGQIEIR